MIAVGGIVSLRHLIEMNGQPGQCALLMNRYAGKAIKDILSLTTEEMLSEECKKS